MKSKLNAEKIIWLLLVIISFIMVVLPVYIMFKYSISDRATWVTGGKYPVPFWPIKPTFEMYKYYISDSRFINSAILSMKIALATVSFSVILGAPAAYALSRFKFNSKAVLLTLIVAIRLIPDVSSVIPISVIFNIGVMYKMNIVLKLALAHSLLGLPYIIYIAQGVFDTIPVDLDEQAIVLGASKLYAFTNIVLPVAVPGLAAGAIYVFLLSWNEFVFSYFVTATSSVNVLPLPVFLKGLFGAFSPSPVAVCTLSLLVSLPVIFFTFIIQKYMVAGATDGAVK